MKKIYFSLLAAFLLLAFNTTMAQTPILTMIGDGDCTGGNPKFIEIYASGTVNFADYSIENQSNASLTWGNTFNLAALGTVTNDYVYVYYESATGLGTFASEFPNATNALSNGASTTTNNNGDDRLRIINAVSLAVIDQFGVSDVDGTGTTWEYTDGYARRNNGTGPDAGFTESNWTIAFNGFNNLGLCQGGSSTFEAISGAGTYQLVSTPTMNIESPTFTINEGSATTVVTKLIIDPAAASNGTYQIHLVGGTGSAADLDLTAFGGGPFPLTLPYVTGNDTLDVPITPMNDAVYEGTETFEFVLRNATGGLILGADSTFTLTMTDDELPPDTTVNFNPIAVSANEGAGTVDLTLEIGQLSVNGTTFTVDVQLTTGDAADLNSYTTQTVSFAPAGSTTQTVTLTITDDALVEGTESLVFTLVNPSAGLTLGSDITATLTLTDNDAPTYTIASLTTVDANGNPDSLGVNVELDVVVMGINYGDAPNVNFYIHDGTGGMGVFSSNSFGYTVNEGDNITLRGKVEFFNGLTQIGSVDTIYTTSGTTPLPAVAAITSLGEAQEGELVKLSNVTVVDQTDWNTGVGAGFNVEVTDGTNTFSVRIDKSADLFNMALPGCVLNVTGIGSQFDNSSPYTSGYQLLPRYMADVEVVMPCSSVTLTIADATEVDANGEPVLFGTDVELRGIITSPDFRELQPNGTEFTFSDGTGGIWAFTTDSTVSFDPIVGDSVVVIGNIGSGSGVTRVYIDSVFSLGSATPFTPTLVTTALTEAQEGELITIENLSLTGTWNTSGGSYNVSAVSGNGVTYDIRIDADRAELFLVALAGSDNFNLTGIGSQFDATAPRTEGYQILPRFGDDIEIISGIQNLELANLTVYPVPASNKLNFAFDFNQNENANVVLVDVLGKIVVSKEINLSNGVNINYISVESLTTGIYSLQIQTSKGVSYTSVLVK